MKSAPKTSFSSVEEYLSFQPDHVKTKLEELRNLIRKTVPQAEELISYQMPAFRFHGMLAYYAGYQKHYGLYVSPAVLKLFKDQLSAYKLSKATIQFTFDQPLPKKLVKEIIQYTAKENLLNFQRKEDAKKTKLKK